MHYEQTVNQPQLIVTLNVSDLEAIMKKCMADAIRTCNFQLQEPVDTSIEEALLSIDELCKKLNVSRDLVYRLRKQGRITGYTVGKRKFFKFSEVLKQCKTKLK